jgi:hypothetical protein
MNIKVSQYTPGKLGNFYIQCKGLHSGRPLLFPIPNCFVIETDKPELYQIAYALWVGKYYYPFIKGSVVPYIRIGDAMELLLHGCDNYKPEQDKIICTLEKIDRLMESLKHQMELHKGLKIGLCRKLFV